MLSQRNIGWSRRLVVGGLLFGATAASVPAPLDSCSAAREWAQANLSVLPRNYTSIVTLPAAYRRAVYDALSVQERVQLWRAQLEQHRNDVDLTDIQRDALSSVIAQLPVIFRTRNGVEGATADTLRRTLVAQFGAQKARTLFATLGPASDVGTVKPQTQVRSANLLAGLAELAALGDRAISRVMGNPPAIDCNCAMGSDWCGGGTSCGTTHGSCIRSNGCGTLWLYECNGNCYNWDQ